MANVQKQSPKKTLSNAKIIKKTDKTLRFVDNIVRDTKENKKLPKRKDDTNNNKKNATLKLDSNVENGIQVNDTDSSMTIG